MCVMMIPIEELTRIADGARASAFRRHVATLEEVAKSDRTLLATKGDREIPVEELLTTYKVRLMNPALPSGMRPAVAALVDEFERRTSETCVLYHFRVDARVWMVVATPQGEGFACIEGRDQRVPHAIDDLG
jgi:hypothetical protein